MGYSWLVKPVLNGSFQFYSLIIGKERFRTISPSYYNGAQAIMVVYDITDPDSFIEVRQYWINEIFGYFGEEADHHIPIILVGTKLDLVDKYDDTQVIVRLQDVKDLKGKHDRLIGPIECSAQTGKNVDKVFNVLTKELFDRDLPNSSTGYKLTSKIDAPITPCEVTC